jgi:hypothetical protein
VNPEDAVKWMMQRLMASTAESFELALARFDAREREAALAHAKRLIGSDDPAERELGERLRDGVLQAKTVPLDRLFASGEGADDISPLSLPSSGASLNGATSPLANASHLGGSAPEDTRSMSESFYTSNTLPQKRPRGRPRKHPLP